jgi:hypothetical protein|tara:strand:- start:1299 stop:1646 length:348 start_codon:yes stop_codon:yes gene_type:complete
MTLNNIDTQFANARAEIRELIKHVNPNTTLGGQTCDILQGIVDTLDAVQQDSYNSTESFYRYQQVEDQPLRSDDEPTNPSFQAFADLEGETRPVQTLSAADLDEIRQTDRLCFWV